MKITAVICHKSKKINLKRIEKVLNRCKALLPPRSFLSLAFIDDKQMTVVNERYTGREGSTDVLSFQLGIDKVNKRWCGEILISLDRAVRQAKEKKVSLIQEIVRLVVHGVVHLSGADHYDRKSFKEMRGVEFKYLMTALEVL